MGGVNESSRVEFIPWYVMSNCGISKKRQEKNIDKLHIDKVWL